MFSNCAAIIIYIRRIPSKIATTSDSIASIIVSYEPADCCVTPSTVPVLFGEWVKKGAHINAVGACSKTARELDSQCVAKAKLFCDNYDSCRNEAGDYLFPLNEGVINESHLLGDLGEVVSGKVVTRTSAEDITIFESQGLACEDVVCAAWLLKQ